MREIHPQSGQIGLVVLLIMTTMLTVGIGAISRSTQDLRITRQELESSQLFNAAEAGIEEGLADLESGVSFNNGRYQGTTTVEDIQVDYEIQEISEINTTVQENQVFFISTDRGAPQPADVLTLEWAMGQNCSTDNPASIIVNLYSHSKSTITEGHAKCNRNDGFTVGSGSININLTNDIIKIGIRPIYSSTNIRASTDGAWILPLQGYRIESVAKLPNSDETKAIVLDKTIRMTTSILEYNVYSGTTIIMK